MATIDQKTEITPVGLMAPDSGRGGHWWASQTPTETITITHELGKDLAGSRTTRYLSVAPSDEPTIVAVTSQVVTESARRMNSPEYLATVRRRKCEAIEKMVFSLAKKAHRDDFAAFTFKVFDEIRELLGKLTVVPKEGNACEILRQIRDSFFDGGHERYRDPKARDLVRSILTRLSEAEDVTPEDVDEVWDELMDGGLAARFPAIFTVEEGKEEADE